MNNKDNIIETFTELAPRYEEVVNAELDRFWGWSYSAFVNQLIQVIEIPREGRILDLATGTGVIPIRITAENSSETAPQSSQSGSAAGSICIHGLDITMPMLARAKKKMVGSKTQGQINLVCASAMEIPYACGSFHLVTCALATHHMDVRRLLSEGGRVLQEEGRLAIADVGGSNLWKLPVVKFFLRIAAFLYFLLTENIQRAWAEAGAVSNVRSKDEWSELLLQAGFRDISITKLKSKHNWVPEPLIILATKSVPGGPK